MVVDGCVSVKSRYRIGSYTFLDQPRHGRHLRVLVYITLNGETVKRFLKNIISVP